MIFYSYVQNYFRKTTKSFPIITESDVNRLYVRYVDVAQFITWLETIHILSY
jgi:hypothetical protein